MTKLDVRGGAASLSFAQKPFRTKLMLAASVGMMSFALPGGGLYGTRAWAQLPAGCDDTIGADPGMINNGDGYADPGETIECVSDPLTEPIGRISNNSAQDLTIIVGAEGGSPGDTVLDDTTTNNSTVRLIGSGDLTLNNRASGEIYNTALNTTQTVVMQSSSGGVSITNDGAISSGAFDAAVSNSSRRAVFARVSGGSGDLTINSLGVIEGSLYARQSGSGSIDLSVSDIQSSNQASTTDVDDATIGVRAESNTSAIDLDAGRVTAGFEDAIFIRNLSLVSANTDVDLIRYDTTQSEAFSDHTGWAGITIAF